MKSEQQINFLNNDYNIISIEQEYLVHPVALGYLPLSTATQPCTYSAYYHIEDYRLYLDRLVLTPGTESQTVSAENHERIYDFDHFLVSYHGAVLIGSELMKEYDMKGIKPASFSYLNVLELIFEDGVLITTVDQSKAMQRIRKNIELGLRNLAKAKDYRCISHFMNSVFVGDYRPFRLKGMRMRYLKNMKNKYSAKNLINN